MEFGMDIIATYGTFSIIFNLVTTDMVGDNWCGRFGLWPFQSVAVSVCGRSGLWPFRFVAILVCGRSGLWPFRFVAVSVMAISVCGRYDLLPTGTILLICPANQRPCYFVTSSLIGWPHTQNDPWSWIRNVNSQLYSNVMNIPRAPGYINSIISMQWWRIGVNKTCRYWF